MEERQQEDLGLCSDIFVSSRPDDDAVVVGGNYRKSGAENTAWSRIFNKRAAYLLWYKLTSVLFPEKAQKVTGLVSTAPLSSMTLNPLITTHADVTPGEDDHYDIKGIMGRNHIWTARLNGMEARRLWTALDLALYPNGWETGTKSTPATPEVKPVRRRQSYQ